MIEDNYDVAIVGSGVSGLLAASEILRIRPQTSLIVLERNSTIGGRARVVSVSSPFDLGGCWTWGGDPNLNALLKRLNISKFCQPQEGLDVIVDSPVSKRTIDTFGQLIACGPGGHRISGGLGGVAAALCREVEHLGGMVRTNTTVTKISSMVSKLRVSASTPIRPISINARFVLIAAPPQLVASKIEFDPPIPKAQRETMKATQTWMAKTGKAIAVYQSPWWKNFNLSLCSTGTSRVHGVIDITWDNSDYSEGKFAIGMFVQQSATTEKVKEELKQIFENAPEPTDVVVKIWDDIGLSGVRDGTESYGSEILRESVCDSRCLFGGTETENEHGHVEGAVLSGIRSSKRILKLL